MTAARIAVITRGLFFLPLFSRGPSTLLLLCFRTSPPLLRPFGASLLDLWFLLWLFQTFFSFLPSQKQNKQRWSAAARRKILRGEKNNSILIKIHLSVQKVNCWWISRCLINQAYVCVFVCVAFRLSFSCCWTWKEQIIIAINQPFKSTCALRSTQIQMLSQWF